ncbi:hypothetical protein L210DRAFT_3441230 [Boletus edulis BED1]|uniref:Uncharacterized protein n=1 Tax=Boletus edulis BED1 TaxID=1328754 RepID=A0AAD4C499_BOLED|nr:hypothetical protein L210DRAFT_3441230 [Boletus edulis BED1]
MSPQALLSRTIDPLLGVFTGCLAYYLYETNPRTALPPDQRLGALLQWKLAKRQRETRDGQSPQGEVQGPSGSFEPRRVQGTG